MTDFDLGRVTGINVTLIFLTGDFFSTPLRSGGLFFASFRGAGVTPREHPDLGLNPGGWVRRQLPTSTTEASPHSRNDMCFFFSLLLTHTAISKVVVISTVDLLPQRVMLQAYLSLLHITNLLNVTSVVSPIHRPLVAHDYNDITFTLMHR
jgi:hypothetical protein